MTVPRFTAVAFGALCASLLLTGCTGDPDRSPWLPMSPPDDWHALPAPPLTPRHGALGAWTGREVLFIGGFGTAQHCVGFGPCDSGEPATGGAAFDPTDNEWRSIADPPVQLASDAVTVMVRDELVVASAEGEWLSYRPASDEWSRLPAPPSWTGRPSLASKGGQVYAVSEDAHELPVMALDLATRVWTPLPADETGPALASRSVTATPRGVVVTGVDRDLLDGRPRPPETIASVWRDGSWRRLPPSSVDPTERWHWTGERLVALVPHHLRGQNGTVAAAALNVGSGSWTLDRDAVRPTEIGALSADDADVADGPRVLTGSVLYDDSSRAWSSVPNPLPAEFSGSTAVLGGGHIYLYGGQRGFDEGSDEGAGEVLGGAWALDVADAEPLPPVATSDLSNWTRLADAPLSRRDGVLLVQVGDQVLAYGGWKPRPCPQIAYFCGFPDELSDGAAYDMGTGRWRRIAQTPVSLYFLSSYAVVGDQLVAFDPSRPARGLVSYDVSEDRWSALPPPPVGLTSGESRLVALGGRVAHVTEEDYSRPRLPVQVLDVEGRTWATLPLSRNPPLLSARNGFRTGRGLMILGAARPRHSPAGLRAEVFEDGGWKRLQDPGFRSYGFDWHFTGRRLIAPFPVAELPRGLALRPGTGRWLYLPQVPRFRLGWQVDDSAGSDFVVSRGYVYDDRLEHWARLGRPPGAAHSGSSVIVGRTLLVVDERGQTWTLDLRVPDTPGS